MLVTLPGIVTLARLMQPENASLPMLVTLPGTVRDQVGPAIERRASDAGDRQAKDRAGEAQRPNGPKASCDSHRALVDRVVHQNGRKAANRQTPACRPLQVMTAAWLSPSIGAGPMPGASPWK